MFRVDSAGNITANGTAIRIKGGSWFGLEGRYELSTDPTNPSGAPMEQYMGNVFWAPSGRTYVQDINEFKAMGINTVRIPISPQTLTGTDPQGMAPNLKNDPSVVIPNSLLALQTIIKDLDAAGIYVILDIHSCSNYVDWRKGRLDARPPYVDATRNTDPPGSYLFSREDSSCSATNNPASVTRIQAYNETSWLANLRTLAGMESSLGVSNLMGIDLYNEPWDYTWADWSKLAGDAYTAIQAVNPNLLMFVEGTSNVANTQDGIVGNEVTQPYGTGPEPNWGGNLFSAGANPPAIPKNQLVFTPHVYGISVSVNPVFVNQTAPGCAGLSGDAAGDAKCPLIMPSAATLAVGWDQQWGYLKAMGYAVVIGEFGGNMSWPGGKASIRDQNRYSYVTDHTIDAQWQQAFVNYLVAKGIDDSIYWSINPESGDTGGLYTTPYDPISNTSGWGTWGALDQTKMTMLAKLWNAPIVGPGPTPTPTVGPSATPTVRPSATPTVRPSVTPTVGPTPTPTVRPSATPTVRPSVTPTVGPTPTPTVRPSVTPTVAPTPTPIRTASPTPAPTGTGSSAAKCSAAITENAWSNGFTANVTVTNTGTVATKTWKVTWTWNGNQTLVNSWNATITQSGTAVTAVNMAYNNVIAGGGNTTFGMQASFTGTNTVPTLTCSAT